MPQTYKTVKTRERITRAFKVIRFTIYTGLEKTSFECDDGRKGRTELTNILTDGKS